METNKITEEQALELALDTLEDELTSEELESLNMILGCNDQVCVYEMPNGEVEAEIYADAQITGLGTKNAALHLPEDSTRNGLIILFYWDIDELASTYFQISRI